MAGRVRGAGCSEGFDVGTAVPPEHGLHIGVSSKGRASGIGCHAIPEELSGRDMVTPGIPISLAFCPIKLYLAIWMIAIFSDLHLSPRSHTRHEELFVQTLRSLRQQGVQELWLLGDIFDLMVGPYHFWQQSHLEFFQELEQWINHGLRIIWVQGNHEFCLERMLVPMGVEISDSHIECLRFGLKCYLAHGDLVDEEDKDYQKWRAFTRSRGFQALLNNMPGWIAKFLVVNIGEFLSSKSRGHRSDRRESGLGEKFLLFYKSKMREGYQAVFLGHSHIFAEVHDPDSFYLNLGSWRNYSPRYALWEAGKRPVIRVILDD